MFMSSLKENELYITTAMYVSLDWLRNFCLHLCKCLYPACPEIQVALPPAKILGNLRKTVEDGDGVLPKLRQLRQNNKTNYRRQKAHVNNFTQDKKRMCEIRLTFVPSCSV